MTDTPNRPPLSPAAQAVLNAYDLASDGNYINGEWIQDHAGQLASALRAAVEQVEHCRDAADQADRLLDLAAELEGHQ